MRKLYCRNCGYDLSPMFARGEESCTCPECGSLASTYFLRDRDWRKSVMWRSIRLGAILNVLATIGLIVIAVVSGSFESFAPLWPCTVLLSTSVATGFAAVSFRERVRVRAAGGEFWAYVLGVCILSGFVNACTLALITSAAMIVWALATK